eukprot:1979205-Amphidinium_carterae.2
MPSTESTENSNITKTLSCCLGMVITLRNRQANNELIKLARRDIFNQRSTAKGTKEPCSATTVKQLQAQLRMCLLTQGACERQ